MNELITMVNGTLMANSRDVAEHFEKQHSEILKKVYGYSRDNKHVNGIIDQFEPSVNALGYFISSEYTDSKGEVRKECWMTRDGFTLAVMGLTGAKALQWKIKYIEAFNQMETKLLSIDKKSTLLMSIYSGGQEAIIASKELVVLETKPLLDKIDEYQPHVDFAKHIGESMDTIDMLEMTKVACKKGIKIGRTNLFKLLRRNDILMEDNQPYQRYIDWFEVVEQVYDTGYTTKIGFKPLVTSKGQAGIIRLLKKEYGSNNAE